MRMQCTRKKLFGVLPLATALLLSACGSDDTAPVASSGTSISGVVATGAAVAGATVSAKCKDGQSYSAAATTTASGAYSISGIPASAYPCAIKVSGATLPAGTSALYSIASSAGNANVTPLTSLVLAKAIVLAGAGNDLDTWFAGAGLAAGLQALVSNHLSDAAGVLHSLMSGGGSGYSWPTGSFNPFTTSFTPQPGNAYDDLLEQLKRALAAPGAAYTTLDALVAALAGGGSVTLPVVPEDEEEEEPGDSVTLPSAFAAGEYGVRINTTGTVGGNAESNVLRVWSGNGEIEAGSTAGKLGDVYITSSSPAGSFGLKDIPDTAGTYPCGGSIGTAAIAVGYGASGGYSSVGTSGVPGFRCTLTITSVGTRDGSNYSGVIEGTFDAQLFKTGAAVNLATSVSVAGRFRIGTPVSGGGSGNSPVAKAAAFDFGASDETARAAMVGTYDVAIYDAPSAAQTGPGKLVVSNAGGTFSLTLKNAAGDELVTRTANDTSCGDGICINLQDQLPADPAGVYVYPTNTGRRVSVYNYYQGGNSTGPGAYFAVNVFGNGVIAGNTAGYYFRNEVTAYGVTVPDVFTALAGSYTGPAQQQLCNPNPVSVTITAGGNITTTGKSSVSCAAQNVSVSWDGLDDLLVPDVGGGSRLVLDTRNGGGSLPSGGHYIKLDSSVPPQITRFLLPFAGAAGDITSIGLVRQ